MDMRTVIKGVASLVGSSCAGWTIERFIRSYMIPRTNVQKWSIKIGAWVIGGLISAKASDYLETETDQVFEIVDKLIGKPVKEIEPVEVKEA